MLAKAEGALCEECPLAKKPCARTQSPANPKAAIVSRSPGYHEGMSGRPFSGPSGQVLDFLLKQNGVTRDDVLVTNTVLCTPEAGKVPPEAIKACAPRLRRELESIPLIIACGSEAVNELVGRGSIDRYRGQRIRRGNSTVVATNNPALVLRDDSTFPNLKRDFKRAFNPLPRPVLPKVRVIEDASDAAAFIESIPPGLVAADIETRGGLSKNAELISIQFAIEGDIATVIGERGGIWQDTAFVDNVLRPFLESEDYSYVWHGGKFDIKVLRTSYNINARVDHDTMLLSYALDERSGGDEHVGIHGLEYLLMDTFGWPKYTSPAVERAKKTGIVEDYDEFYEYAGRDVAGTHQLHTVMHPAVEKIPELYKMYQDKLIAGTEVLAEMEMHGFPYDVERASDVYEFEVGPELLSLTEGLRKQVDNPLLNPRSPIQVARYFYDLWGIRHEMQSRPDKKRSVDEAARKEILAGRFKHKGDDEQGVFIQTFTEKYDRFQELAKQASTYILRMIERAEADPESRVYTQLNMHGTNSGRLSSSKPNLQNITRTKPGLPDIRKLFKASPGRKIVNFDFSQAELRCIAEMSGDPLLSKVYHDGLDLHSETAKRFYGENFTKQNRDTSKNVNFGVFYRQTAATFQEKHGIPEKEAQPYIDWVWKTFLGVKDWESGIEKEIHEKKYLVSPFGRRRRFHLITKENRQALYREGINFLPQTTASDLTLTSAIEIHHRIDRRYAALVLTVHDSILGDVVEKYIDEYVSIVKEVMESCALRHLGWKLPFKADFGVGPTWGECA